MKRRFAADVQTDRKRRWVFLYAAVVLAMTTTFDLAAQSEFAFTLGSTGDDNAVAVAISDNGNTYLAGEFSGTVDFDPDSTSVEELVSANQDGFLSSYDASGNFRWAFRLGSGVPTNESIGGLDLDDNTGTLAVVGTQPIGLIDFDPDTAVVEKAGLFYVATYDTNATFRFVATAEAVDNSSAALAQGTFIDTAGNVYVTGTIAANVLFDGIELTSDGGADGFIAKYSPLGDQLLAMRVGGTGDDQLRAIAADSQGNIFITGKFEGTAEFDPLDSNSDGNFEPRTSVGGYDLFVASYDSAGVFRFAHALGGTDDTTFDDVGNDVEVDNDDNIYVVGFISGETDFNVGGGVVTRETFGNGSAFLASYAPDMTLKFVSVPTGSGSVGYDVMIDDTGRSVMAGTFGGSLDLDPGPDTTAFTSSSGTDSFAARYHPWGGFSLGYSIPSSGLSSDVSIDLDGEGNSVIAGSFSGEVDLDPLSGTDIHVSAGRTDLYLARFPSSLIVNVESPDPIIHAKDIEVLSAYPNPFSHVTTVVLDLAEPTLVTIEVVDLLGRVVQRDRLPPGTRTVEVPIVLDDSFAGGVYLVRATTAAGKSSSTLVVKS